MNTVNAIKEASKNYITPEYIIRNTIEDDISSGIIEDGENIETYVDEVWIAVSRLLSQKLVRESAEIIKEKFVNNMNVELLNDEELLLTLENLYNDIFSNYKKEYQLYDHSFSDEDFLYHFFLRFFYNDYFLSFFHRYVFG